MTQIETTNERVVIGQVVPFDRGSVPAVREDYTKAIQLWCQTRDTAAALTREEIGAMRKDDRIDAHRKAIIINLAHYYRENPRADVAPGVLVVLTLLSDNEKGAASISQPTLAKLFDRALSSIGEAQKRLKDAGVIVTSRGRYAATYPVIPRAVTTSYNHLTWLVSAVCEHDDGAVNLPVPPVDCQSTGLPGGLKPDGNQSTGPASGLKLVNQPVEDVSINRSARCLLQDTNSKEEREPTREGAIGKVAASVMTGMAILTPLAAAAAQPHPVGQVMQAPAECWQIAKAQMAAGMSKQEADAQKQVWVTSTGGLEIAGAFKDEMRRMFPLVDMTSALAAACVNVKVDSGAWTALQVVRRQFGFMQQDATSKQARSASYSRNSPDRQSEANSKFTSSIKVPMQKPRPLGEEP